jgi:hypothetical protein
MKKLLLLAVSCLLVHAATAQNKHVQAYCDRQCGTGKTQVRIPGFILRLCADDPELRPFLKGMRSLRVTHLEKHKNSLNNSMGLDRALLADGYEEMLSVKEDGEQLGIYIIANEDRIRSILLAVDDREELVLLSAKVNMTLQELGKLLSGSGKQQLKSLAGLK